MIWSKMRQNGAETMLSRKLILTLYLQIQEGNASFLFDWCSESCLPCSQPSRFFSWSWFTLQYAYMSSSANFSDWQNKGTLAQPWKAQKRRPWVTKHLRTSSSQCPTLWRMKLNTHIPALSQASSKTAIHFNESNISWYPCGAVLAHYLCYR